MNRDELNKVALDPARCVVVEACAGSGKTWLLVSRMVRQLIAGAAPSEILAITFTRKAAQEMQLRLTRDLDFLAIAEETKVRQFLRERSMNEAQIACALPVVRGLRDLVAFASPGVTITTFHAWFQQLLSQAPLPYAQPHTQITDSVWTLKEEAWQRMGKSLSGTVAHESGAEENAKKQAFTRLFSQFGLQSTKKMLNDFIDKRAEWQLFVHARLQLDVSCDKAAHEAMTRLATQLHIDPNTDPTMQWQQYFQQLVLQLAMAFANGTDKARACADTLQSAFDKTRNAISAEIIFEKVRITLLTQKDTLRVQVAGWAEKAGATLLLADIVSGLLQTIEANLHHQIWQQNADAFTAGVALLEQYETIKQEKQALDYSDLEWRSYELLSDSEHAETMQYKLDCRYRHILLDEFQDTNPLQWLTLKCWLDASVAADNRPSVFMVGDPKQAIYRFRRADARLFNFCRQYLVAEFNAHCCTLDRSFRNAPAIIDFVNGVFAGRDDFQGFVAHTAEQQELHGAVVALAAFTSDTNAHEANNISPHAWRNPLTTAREETRLDSRLAEAAQLAQSIAQLVACHTLSDSPNKHRAARYGDIMILFRRRTHLTIFQDALKAHHIPYVGAKPGGLLSTLEARDIAALLRFLATPDDDLSLAHALKSPLFGLTDSALASIADAPAGQSWWQKCLALEALDAPLLKARSQLFSWLTLIDRMPTHDVLDRIYHELDIYAAYARAAPSAMRRAVLANLDAFMALALSVDSGRYPSLQRFLDELAAFNRLPDNDAPDEGDISRDQIGVTDAVQLMTIHGAKGLEAPIVFLIDCAQHSSKAETYNVLLDWPLGEAAPSHFSFNTTKEFRGEARGQIYAADEISAERENLNLLYVGATRAKQLLIISGTAGKRESSETSWLDLAQAVELTPFASIEEIIEPIADHAATPTTVSPTLTTEKPGVTSAVAPVVTSIGVRETYSDAQDFGIAVHRWLEILTADGVENTNADEPNPNNDAAFGQARQIINSPDMTRFYRNAEILNARNEMELSFIVDGKIQTRRIDRLVEFENEVWLLDYKTGAFGNADHFQSQLNEYRQVVATLYPRKSIHAAIIDRSGKLIAM